MGQPISSLVANIVRKKEVRILMLGLHDGGKTTILDKLGEITITIPTLGFNIESVKYKNIQLLSWNMGGQQKDHSLWRLWYQDVQGVVFVVDSTDRDRVDEAREELERILGEDKLRNAHVLIFANKQDLPNTMSPSEIADKLRLRSLQRTWSIQSTCATNGDGIYDGLEWLSNSLDGRHPLHDSDPVLPNHPIHTSRLSGFHNSEKFVITKENKRA